MQSPLTGAVTNPEAAMVPNKVSKTAGIASTAGSARTNRTGVSARSLMWVAGSPQRAMIEASGV